MFKQVMLDARVDPSNPARRIFVIACAKGHTEIVKLLLQDPRIDPSFDDNFPISCASQNGHLEVVNLLLADARVSASTGNSHELFNTTVYYGQLEVVKRLLEYPHIDPSDNGNRALQIAKQEGHTLIEELLLTDPRVRRRNEQMEEQTQQTQQTPKTPKTQQIEPTSSKTVLLKHIDPGALTGGW
jgi:hypothetical protein